MGLILESGWSVGVGNGNLLQYSCLGNSMDRRTWQATVHGVAKSQTQQNLNTHTHKHSELEGNTIIEITKSRKEDRERWGETWVRLVKKASGSRNSTGKGHVLSTGGLGSEPWQEQSRWEDAWGRKGQIGDWRDRWLLFGLAGHFGFYSAKNNNRHKKFALIVPYLLLAIFSPHGWLSYSCYLSDGLQHLLLIFCGVLFLGIDLENILRVRGLLSLESWRGVHSFKNILSWVDSFQGTSYANALILYPIAESGRTKPFTISNFPYLGVWISYLTKSTREKL